MPLSMFRNKKDSGKPNFFRNVNYSVTWLVFLDEMENYFGTPYANKEDAPLYSPTVYLRIERQKPDGTPCAGYRNVQNATVSGMAVLDFDNGSLMYDDAVT